MAKLKTRFIIVIGFLCVTSVTGFALWKNEASALIDLSPLTETSTVVAALGIPLAVSLTANLLLGIFFWKTVAMYKTRLTEKAERLAVFEGNDIPGRPSSAKDRKSPKADIKDVDDGDDVDDIGDMDEVPNEPVV